MWDLKGEEEVEKKAKEKMKKKEKSSTECSWIF